MKILSFINQAGFSKMNLYLILGFVLLGLYFGLGKNGYIISPAFLLLTPLRNKFSTIFVTINIIMLILLSLAIHQFGTPVFTTGIPYYFQKIVNSYSPILILLFLLIKNGQKTKWLLTILIPSFVFAPTLYFLSYIAFLSHPFKISRIIFCVLLLPVCLILTVFGSIFALGNLDYLCTNKIADLELAQEVSSRGDVVRAYYEYDMMGPIRLVIRREQEFMSGVVLVKNVVEFDSAPIPKLQVSKDQSVLYTVGKDSGTI